MVLIITCFDSFALPAPQPAITTTMLIAINDKRTILNIFDIPTIVIPRFYYYLGLC
ncbi:protein of unknown function [Paenibacillus alvei]|uniref:Uncharacterized protein n=1 Tax=Paenibacillus alvei TaxID=44250 RepID=A0A383R4A8_PAEAL|nr:protein of unknown function [Paenibacillus alvei]